jgi:hypothetical protein
MFIGFHVKQPYFCHILIKPEFSRLILKKFSNDEFYENRCSGSRVVPCGRTDRQTDGRKDRQKDGNDIANSPFSQFCKRA